MALKQATQTALIQSVQEYFLQNYARPEVTLADLQADEGMSAVFGQFFNPIAHKNKKNEKNTEKSQKKKKEASPKISLDERQSAGINESKCLCRIWKDGLDSIQCSSNAVDGLYCKSHSKKISEHGSWWLGTVDSARPEEPFGPPTSKKPGRHYWSDREKPEKVKSSKEGKKEKKEKKETKEKKGTDQKKENKEKKEKKNSDGD